MGLQTTYVTVKIQLRKTLNNRITNYLWIGTFGEGTIMNKN